MHNKQKYKIKNKYKEKFFNNKKKEFNYFNEISNKYLKIINK